MISCIIPSYNSEATISATLEALLFSAREHDDIEIIVSDNKSTDNTIGVVKRYPDIKVVICNKRGIGPNRNNGAKYAKGDILVFTDDDNIVSEWFFSEIKMVAESTDNAGGGCKNIIPTRKSLGILLFFFCVYPKCKINHIGIGAFWVRKWVFDTIGGFTKEIGTLEDIDFAIRLKAFCDNMGMKYKNLKLPYYWSTRKFDEYGDWYWVKNLYSFLKAIYTTKCDKKAIEMWYGLSS